ncbi:potassium voltage-gated channel subfamily A member 6-like [Xenia sp. Carnegie-2017]|uniref:potassium voltage-gated channel subfamily A member 6-like n=1 Tax=Xenia sp. Carnegie-2017 TaxID=2897299 RepID=UPI001F0372FA|nr:potassium voltage-gated channel subfamily A member 6-like [Xenia sp. Carnegie-2017]
MVNNNAEIQDQTKVMINIRGTIYETFESTLARYPNTLMGSFTKTSPYYNSKKQQYCLDRDRKAFDSILFYYQSRGKLIRPIDVDETIFLSELQFFNIDHNNVTQLEYGSSNFSIPKTNKRAERNSDVHTFFDIFLSWPCGVIVVTYILTLCLLSSLQYQQMLSNLCGRMETNSSKSSQNIKEDNHPFIILQYTCGVWFVFEFILRLRQAECKPRYTKSILGIADIITVVSIFSQLFIHHFDWCVQTSTIWLANITRICSLVCMFKLSRYSTGLKLFGVTVKACAKQLILSFYCVGLCILVFSFIIYYSEENVNPKFESIIDAFWYTIVTLTTVGYGDLVPVSVLGKIFGGICCVFGVTIVMAWPATIFVSYFQQVYNYEIGLKKKKSRNYLSSKIMKIRRGLMQLDNTGCAFK